MDKYLGVIIFIIVIWSLAGLKWYLFDRNPSELMDRIGNGMMIIFSTVLIIGAYIYQTDRTYPPNKGRDHAYYTREASIKKQIDSILADKKGTMKPARRLNEDLYQKDIPIEEMIRKYWGGSKEKYL